SGLAAGELNIAEAVDPCVERWAHHRGGVVLGNHRWTFDTCTRREGWPPIDRPGQKFAARRIEHQPPRFRFRFCRLDFDRHRKPAFRRRSDRDNPAQNLDLDAWNMPAIE